MKKFLAALMLAFAGATPVLAVPLLQIGAPAGAGDSGLYADYRTIGADEETAFTTGSHLLVAGIYPDDAGGKTYLNLGGRFAGGSDWGAVDSQYSILNGMGAVLVVTVPVSTNGDIRIKTGDSSLFAAAGASSTNNLFANQHAPLNGDVKYLYFDIGNFARLLSVPNLDEEGNAADPDPGGKLGEIKDIYLDLTGYDGTWAHFDVMALLTSDKRSEIITGDVSNPNSHDVTVGNGGEPVPEPGTLFLLGTGLLVVGLYRRKMRSR